MTHDEAMGANASPGLDRYLFEVALKAQRIDGTAGGGLAYWSVGGRYWDATEEFGRGGYSRSWMNSLNLLTTVWPKWDFSLIRCAESEDENDWVGWIVEWKVVNRGEKQTIKVSAPTLPLALVRAMLVRANQEKKT